MPLAIFCSRATYNISNLPWRLAAVRTTLLFN